MATINGTNVVLSMNGTALALSKECDLDLTHAGRDTTTKDDSGWQTHAEGLRSWKVTGKGLADFSASGNFTTLFQIFKNRTPVSVTFSAAGSGNKYYSGSGIIKSLKGSGPMEESGPYDFEIDGSGILTESSHT